MGSSTILCSRSVLSKKIPTLTRNSANAVKPRYAFRGQSRSPNMIPFHMLLTVKNYCAISNFIRERVDFKNAVTLKTGLGVRQGHWKCHHVIEHI